MDQTFELIESVKRSNKTAAAFGSSLSRSSSSTSIGIDYETEDLAFNIEDILFEFTCTIAKDAGIQELLENFDEATTLYHTANYLVEFLQTPAQFAPISSLIADIPPLNPDYTTNFIGISDKIRDRMSCLQNKIS